MDITKFYARADELPLDELKPDGGFTSIFRTIACIGDSLSSGEMEGHRDDGSNSYHDYFEYSWGQFIARATGSTVYNFSRGGMTAREYIDSFAESRDFWNPDFASRAYIIALGVNDLLNKDTPLGTADDIHPDDPDSNAQTFAGDMGRIISRYKKLSPKGRFFLMTMPRQDSDNDFRVRRKAEAVKLFYDIAEKFEFTYVLDLHKYAPVYDAEFRRNFYLGGHLNAAGYQLTAVMTMSYIDYIIRNNPEDFTQIAFTCREGDIHHHGSKW